MPVYKCSKCECVDNTALGLYWSRRYINDYIWTEENIQYKGEPLCTECAPAFYIGGKSTGRGKWHDKFPKEHISKYSEEERKTIYNS